MIQTSILLELDGNWPIWNKSTGLAKSLPIALWLFEYCGWKREGFQYPDLAYVVETIEWPEGDDIYPWDKSELFILNNRLIMN